jgi:hypothetical protein
MRLLNRLNTFIADLDSDESAQPRPYEEAARNTDHKWDEYRAGQDWATLA